MTEALTYQQRIAAFKSQHGIGVRSRGPSRQPILKRANFEGAKLTRLTADWNPGVFNADSDIQFDSWSLRNRARNMEVSNEWVAGMLDKCEQNILKDECGFSLQMKILRPPTFDMPDKVANAKIEDGWQRWCGPQFCTEEGEDSFYDVTALCLRSALRDGGLLVRKIVDPGANEFGFTLKLIEIDYLDYWYTTILPSGNRVIMGVEKDPRGRRVAYHILTRHPGDNLFGGGAVNAGQYRIRVPANEIIHYFVKKRIGQTHGSTKFAPSMIRLHHLREFEIAELIASREEANKGGYWTSERGDQYKGERELSVGIDGTTSETGTISDSEPGMQDEVPPGMTFQKYDPQHPTKDYGAFVKDALLGAAAGMGISYMSLTGDLSQANYSSMRAGSLAEREGFRKAQSHMIEHLCLPIFTAWLEAALLSGAVNLPASKLTIFNKPSFKGRRWEWVDPSVDIQAALMEIDGGLSTRADWTERQGGDLEDVVAELAQEKTMFDEAGITPVSPQTKLIEAAKINAEAANQQAVSDGTPAQ